MKYLLLLLSFAYSSFCFLQSKPPQGTKFVKTTTSTQYEDSDTLQHKVLFTYYDSLKNVITNENTLHSSISNKKSTSTVITKTDKKYTRATLTPTGDTSSVFIYLYDENGNRTHNFQIMNGDTVVSQLRVYDDYGNSLKLYSNSFFSSEMYLDMEWEYDTHNNRLSVKDYDEFDNIVETTKYENEYDAGGNLKTVTAFSKGIKGKFKIYSITEYSKNKIKTYYYYDSVGYNYGIQLVTSKKGYRIETQFDNGTVKSLEMFDKKGNMQYSVYITNSEI